MNKTKLRKNSHIDICLNEDIDFRSSHTTGFDHFRFEHMALPEISYDEVDTSTTVFGKKLAAPLIIGAMTGGTALAQKINSRLIEAASHCKIGFASGSQRIALEDQYALNMFIASKWKKRPPLYIGNLGAIQLNYGVTVDQIVKLVHATGCDALNLHMNPLQECIQPEGQTNFKKLNKKIQMLSKKLKVPLILKEVGNGISAKQAKVFSKLAIAGVETAGLGGTSWSKIEGLRNSSQEKQILGQSFSQWGIPTAESILNCKNTLSSKTIIASGGLRGGLDLAKSIALGADAGAIALPFLKAAQTSSQNVVQEIETIIAELKTVMFLTGIKNIAQLKKATLIRTHDFAGSSR